LNRTTALVGDAASGSYGGVVSGGTSATSLFLNVLCLGLSTLGLSDSLSILLVLIHSPVKHVVVLEALANEEVAENLAQVRVVWLVVEAKRASVVEVDGKLIWEAAAEDLCWGGHLLLHDAVVLLLLGGSLKTLPWKGATAEVKHNVSQRLHVITTRLLDTQVGVDGGVTSSTGEVLVLTVWDVEVSLWVSVLLGQTKVDNVDLVASLANAHQEVIWLDITVNEGLGVDVFDTRDELIGQKEDSLEGELAVAEVEEIFERWAEKVENHGVVITLCAEPADKGNTDTAGKRLVDTCLIFELRVFGLDAFELDGNFFAGNDVGALAQSVIVGCFVMCLFTHRGKCHRKIHYQSYDQFGTCCRHEDPGRPLGKERKKRRMEERRKT